MLRPTLTALLAALCLALAPRPAAAAGGYLTLSAEDCTRLARHYPADDVTYRPGRDVRGKAVAPADLDPGAGLILPDAVVIPIEIDLFERYGIPANRANRSEEHTSELPSLMRISYAVFCLKQQKQQNKYTTYSTNYTPFT